MWLALQTLWRRNPIGLMAFGLAAVVTLVFLTRFVLFTIYWSDPAHRDQRIEGWMTPGYIARSYDVPKAVVTDALGLGDTSERRQSLEMISDDQGRPLPELEQAIQAAIDAQRQWQK